MEIRHVLAANGFARGQKIVAGRTIRIKEFRRHDVFALTIFVDIERANTCATRLAPACRARASICIAVFGVNDDFVTKQGFGLTFMRVKVDRLYARTPTFSPWDTRIVFFLLFGGKLSPQSIARTNRR
jgi:hypothetical protein